APRSIMCSPARADVAAASRMASWPTRWPLSGWRSTSRPPRTASSLISDCSAAIAAQLVGEAGLLEQPACDLEFILADQNAARENADRAFQHAYVLIDHHVADMRAVEQRLDRRDQHRIVGAN